LVAVQHDETPWVVAGDLPAQFRADRAPRPGDEDNLVGQMLSDGGLIEADSVAPEEVLEVEVAEVEDLRVVLGDPVIQWCQYLDLEAGVPGDVARLSDEIRVGRRDSDDQ